VGLPYHGFWGGRKPMIELIAKVIFGVNATMLLVLAAVYFVAGFRQQ